MGKLNIAHHKSYHPYRRDNIERVRRDEEEARTREAVEEGRMLLADSEARMDLLRQRAGLGTKAQGKHDRDRDRDGEDDVERAISQRDAATAEEEKASTHTAGPSTLTGTTGHINLFEDLERQGSMALMPVRSTKKGPPAASESEKGVALAPSAKDLNPWYSDRDHERTREREAGEDKRLRDLARKSVHDPLTSINSQLASRDRPSSSSSSFRRPGPRPGPSSQPPPRSSVTVSANSSSAPAPAAPGPRASTERLTRESAERQRALELIRRKKMMEGGGSEPSTPSTVRGGGYGDVFNRREIEEVQRARRREHDRDRDREWGRGRERDRDRDRYRESYSTRRW
ncbi:hypothetical protein L226DRAFT_502299 [Lentinus tigrinus ALCF2SS1-7]|uniref:CBF1-interacting co-repressor CIR N-terminal domain-containing protein n=1 Tax=Lentinus tigrinus ALCF2SS1-6 TaxID=1328759 RepID=A0A5C2RRE4_9APHY|nr:hypothetical protein L227DRAFT_512856 [Lentinus tigrinus ALCF2SS1-6]RPD79657.1 hypothetical protein L226DRAFT_502299 [Lentinus tigrinus ALCF2SS1-7]